MVVSLLKIELLLANQSFDSSEYHNGNTTGNLLSCVIDDISALTDGSVNCIE